MTLPGGNTGLRLPAPGRRIHHLGILIYMVIAQILWWFHHGTYAPAQAFRIEMALCRDFFEV